MTVHNLIPRATTHGKRGSAGNLPAGGAARFATPSGRAATDSIQQHPDGRDYGTMGPDWIADQIRRADGDTRPVRPMRVIPDLPHYADLRDGGRMPREPMRPADGVFWIAAAGIGLFGVLVLPQVAARLIVWLAGLF
jgi:hypothetical protein